MIIQPDTLVHILATLLAVIVAFFLRKLIADIGDQANREREIIKRLGRIEGTLNMMSTGSYPAVKP